MTMTAPQRADLATRLRVSRLLDAADLEPEGLSPSAILVVRRLTDAAPASLQFGALAVRAPPEWEGALRGKLTEAWRGAARPALAGVSAGAGAVLFADPAEMLAAHAMDLCAGLVEARWWWPVLLRSPGGPGTEALGRAWRREARYVPAALALLAERGAAADVVARLDPPQARTVLTAVAEAFDLPDIQAALRPAAAGAERGEEGGGGGARTGSADAWPAAAVLEPPWEPHLPAVAHTARLAPDQRALLGVGLLLARTPLIVRTPTFASGLARWRAAVSMASQTGDEEPGSAYAGRPDLPASPTSGRIGEEGAVPPGGRLAIPRPSASPDPTAGAPRPPGAAGGDPPQAGPAEPATGERGPSVEPAGTLDAVRHGERPTTDAGTVPASPPGQETPGPVPEVRVYSDLCGVFFLINALRPAGGWLGQVTERLPDGPVATGWGWLEHVARRLLGRDAREEDPVWRVLAELDGRVPHAGGAGGDTADPVPTDAAVERFLDAAVPPLRDRLRTVLGARGASGPLERTLLVRPGVIQAGRTHVDVRVGADQVTLPVRLAGLDVNPGWVPELGRVITFHFGAES